MPSAIGLSVDHPAFAAALLAHILAGSVGIFFYWRTILATKGGTVHRGNGRRFFVVMLAVALTIGPVIFTTPGPFDPAYVVQFTYLLVCLVSIVTVGWTAIRWKREPERFRGRHFRIMGFAILGLALVVLAAGIAAKSWLTVSFSVIGLIYGPAMLRFAWLGAELHPRWWLGWHLNAVCGLFNAVHANFLAVIYEHTINPGVGDEGVLTTHLATGLIAIGLRVWFGRRYDAPLRFTRAGRAPVAASV